MIHNFSALFIFIGLLKFSVVQGQPVISKSLPDPNYAVIGIESTGFPQFNGPWSDTLSLINYGKFIDLWLLQHQGQIQQLKSKNTGNEHPTIDDELFKKLNSSERQNFKEVALQLAYIIKGQKQVMMDEYFAKNKGKSKRDFYDEVEQIYFIHKTDVIHLLNQIKDQ